MSGGPQWWPFREGVRYDVPAILSYKNTRLEGPIQRSVDARELRGKTIILLVCSTDRLDVEEFLQRLVVTYNSLRARGQQVEIVYVSEIAAYEYDLSEVDRLHKGPDMKDDAKWHKPYSTSYDWKATVQHARKLFNEGAPRFVKAVSEMPWLWVPYNSRMRWGLLADRYGMCAPGFGALPGNAVGPIMTVFRPNGVCANSNAEGDFMHAPLEYPWLPHPRIQNFRKDVQLAYTRLLQIAKPCLLVLMEPSPVGYSSTPMATRASVVGEIRALAKDPNNHDIDFFLSGEKGYDVQGDCDVRGNDEGFNLISLRALLHVRTPVVVFRIPGATTKDKDQWYHVFGTHIRPGLATALLQRYRKGQPLTPESGILRSVREADHCYRQHEVVGISMTAEDAVATELPIFLRQTVTEYTTALKSLPTPQPKPVRQFAQAQQLHDHGFPTSGTSPPYAVESASTATAAAPPDATAGIAPME